ncbi:hypothetical protein [Propionispora hippei]|uniref:Uncharacterized protein, contains a NRPS condensation (Elongation) domain n=1 Tax=Propionispora hippei DSM 15287 TaxID=1123003 RepID=A0A1M6F299_9FIRM|nr:hypothetical protein [Propionispora hippei]SHI91838.1 Uncharacterized protein, contains a NRPS condensation (elongation) domain [Propionispora hippei DSM 15287]
MEHGKRYPAVPQDIFNYLVGKYSANSQLSCVLRLTGRIDERLFEQVLRISLELEPILGCRLIEEDETAYWEWRDDLSQVQLCSVVETLEVEEELRSFIAQMVDFEKDCQIKARVFRAETDTICVMVNHACCDAGGLKEYMELLISIYDHLFKGSQYTVQPPVSYNRGQDEIFQLPKVIAKINTMMNRKEAPTDPGDTVAIPCTLGESINQTVVSRQISPLQFRRLKQYARNNEATINDVCLAALSRSLSKIAKIDNELISLCFTSDLRTYLPEKRTNSIYNLSGMNPIRIHQKLTESFHATLAGVLSETKKVKNDCPGIDMALYFQTLGQVSFKKAESQFEQFIAEKVKLEYCNPWLSNVGVLAKERIHLGSVAVEDYYMIGSGCYSPGFMMIASTYNDTLTLSTNFFESTLAQSTVEQLMDLMVSDMAIFAEG